MSELPHDARAVVVTASNRASAGVYEDRSGKALVEGLEPSASRWRAPAYARRRRRRSRR